MRKTGGIDKALVGKLSRFSKDTLATALAVMLRQYPRSDFNVLLGEMDKLDRDMRAIRKNARIGNVIWGKR